MRKFLRSALGHVSIRKKFILTIISCLIAALFVIMLCMLFAWKAQIRHYIHDHTIHSIDLTCTQLQGKSKG